MRLIVTIFFWLLSAFAVVAEEAEKPLIRWFYQDFPPAVIGSGPLKGQGWNDKTVAYFIERMPQYRHVYLEANLVRTFAEMQFQDGICSGALFITPEREKFIEFSQPMYSIIPNRVIVMQKRKDEFAPFLNSNGEVRLPALLEDRKFRPGIVVERQYSAHINGLFKDLNVLERAMVLPHDRYGLPLANGRFDYTFGYPSEAKFLFRIQRIEEGFSALPIESEPRFIEGSVGCSKKPQGQQVIAEINKIITAEGPHPYYRNFYEEWLDEKEIKSLRAAAIKPR